MAQYSIEIGWAKLAKNWHRASSQWVLKMRCRNILNFHFQVWFLGILEQNHKMLDKCGPCGPKIKILKIRKCCMQNKRSQIPVRSQPRPTRAVAYLQLEFQKNLGGQPCDYFRIVQDIPGNAKNLGLTLMKGGSRRFL